VQTNPDGSADNQATGYLAMNSLVKIQSKGQMTIPRKLRSAVGVSDGDLGQAVTAFAPAFSRQLQ
jgi:hypothetical protein